MKPSFVPANYVKTKDGWSHPSRLVGGALIQKPEPDEIPALVKVPKRSYQDKRCVVVVVTLIRVGSKLLDSDNLCASFKAQRDCCAASLGVADNDSRIVWQYGQVETKGETGTLVMMELQEQQ